jgi:hypothetical protein
MVWCIKDLKVFDDVFEWEPIEGHSFAEQQYVLMNRIRFQLKDRRQEQLNDFFILVNEIYKKYMQRPFEEMSELDWSERIDEKSNKEKEYLNRYDCSAEYFVFMEDYDLKNVRGDSDLEWNEFFAIIALSSLAGLVNYNTAHIKQNGGVSKLNDFRQCRETSLMLFDVYEIISIAESFGLNEAGFRKQIQLNAGKIATKKAKKAAKIKHEPVNKIKEEYINWYLNNNNKGIFKSKNQAAKIFVKSLSLEKSKILAPSNIERTLKDAFREYENTNK